MASFRDNSLPLFLLFLAFSLQIQARESQFFSKVSPASIAEEPATELPPQSHNGYGLYGRDPNNFSSTTTTATTKNSYNFNNNNNNNNGHAYMEPNKIPSTFTNPEFPTENYENEEKRNVNTYNTPFTFSDEEFRRYESKNVPSYSRYDTQQQQQQYGMSDTRLLENGKYFYDVNAERYGKGNTEEYGGGYEPTKGNTEEYDRGYEPTKENTETTYGNEEGRDGYEYKKEMSRDEYEP